MILRACYSCIRKENGKVKNITNILEDVSIVFGVTIGIAQIQTILGIIVLSFQIILIIYKCVVRIYKHAKEKDLKGIENDLEETIDALENLQDKNEDGKQ